MKLKAIVFALALLLVSAVAASADSPHLGTWKLNEAKSKIPKGATKNTTVVYEAAGDQIKVTVDGTDANGNAIHNEWTGKFDGKKYAVTGDPTQDMRSYRVVNSRTLSLRNTKGAKVVATGTVMLSRDGKTRTVTTRAVNAKGQWISTRAVYDKQ